MRNFTAEAFEELRQDVAGFLQTRRRVAPGMDIGFDLPAKEVQKKINNFPLSRRQRLPWVFRSSAARCLD